MPNWLKALAPPAAVTLFGVLVIFLGTLLSALVGGALTERTGSMAGGVGAGIFVNELVFMVAALWGISRLENPPAFGKWRPALLYGIGGAIVILLLDAGLNALVKTIGWPIGLDPMFLPRAPLELATWLCAMLFVPLGEEGFFRGLLPALYESTGSSPWTGMILSSLLFGIIHGGQQLAAMPIAFLLSFVFFALKKKSGGLAAPMLAHLLVNYAGLWLMLRDAAQT